MNSLRSFMFGLGVAAVIGALAIFGASVGSPAPPPIAPGDPPPMAPETTEAPVVKEFQSDEEAGRRGRNVGIAPDTSIDALTALAQRLHAEDPQRSFWIYTDGNEEQFRRLMLWDLHYGTPDMARYPYPEAWANRHGIAMIHEFGVRGTRGPTLCWKLQINQGHGVKPPVPYGHTVDLEPCR
jgi:hypothetical protein